MHFAKPFLNVSLDNFLTINSLKKKKTFDHRSSVVFHIVNLLCFLKNVLIFIRHDCPHSIWINWDISKVNFIWINVFLRNTHWMQIISMNALQAKVFSGSIFDLISFHFFLSLLFHVATANLAKPEIFSFFLSLHCH